MQNSVLLEDGMENMSAAERRKFSEFCHNKVVEGMEDLTKSLSTLYNQLQEINRKLKKRISHIKQSRNDEKLKIVSKNSNKTCEECVSQFENQCEGLFKFDLEDVQRGQHYFAWLASNGHEFCYTMDVLKRLNRPLHEKRKSWWIKCLW